MRFKVLSTAFASFALAVSLAGQDGAREQKLQQAIDLLETKGNAAAAMPLLEEVAKSSDQALAARALLYLGQAQERQGNDAARATYERIIRQYASQSAVVEQARVRLASLSTTAARTATERLLWKMPTGTLYAGRISRDGTKLLFVDNDGLGIRDLVRHTSRLLVKDQGEGDKQTYVSDAVFAPDGRRIAFSLYNGGTGRYELHVADIADVGITNRRQVPDVGGSYIWPLDWSSDGRQLAILYEQARGEQEIALLPVAGGSRHTLLRASKISTFGAAFSNGGRYLAVNTRAESNGSWDIRIFSTGDGSELPSIAHRADDVLAGWTPTDDLLFVSDRRPDVGLYFAQIKSGPVVGEPTLIKSGIGRKWPLGVREGEVWMMKDGAALSGSEVRVASLNLGAGQWIERPQDPLAQYFVGSTQSAEWSPDGKTLAFLTTRASGLRETFHITLQSESGASRELTPRLIRASSLSWLPDGTGFLVWGYDHTMEMGWWRLDLASEQLSPIERGLEQVSQFIRWSADGSKAYFRRQLGEGQDALVQRDLSGGELVLNRDAKGTPPGQAAALAEISPDGRRLYFRRALDDSKGPFRQYAFVERDITQQTEREVTRGQLSYTNLSPDGAYFATGSNDSATKTRSWLLIRTDTGQTKEVMRVPLPPSVAEEGQNLDVLSIVTWSPDSKSVLVRKLAGDKRELWWVPLEGTPQLLDPDWRGSRVRITSNGRVAYQLQAPPSRPERELWVLDNVLPAQVKK